MTFEESPHILDIYSLLIVSKYLTTQSDYINLITTSKKCSCLLDMLHYNPISVENTKLFPKMQTQYLYNEEDKPISGMYRYIVSYLITFVEYEHIDNILPNMYFKHLCFNENDRKYYEFSHSDHCNSHNELTTCEISPLITELSGGCFCGCELRSIQIPTSVKSLGEKCFSYCTDLTGLTLTTSIKSIGVDCFFECTNIKDVSVSDGNCIYGLIPYWLSMLFKDKGIHCYDIEYSIDDVNKSIEQHPEYYDSNNVLTELSIPNPVNHLNCFCFSNTSTLTRLTLTSNLRSVGSNCFIDCCNLKSVIIPNCSVFNCVVPYWVSLLIEENNVHCAKVEFTSVDKEKEIELHPEYLNDSNQLITIQIPESITSIGWGCFWGCSELENIVMTTNVTYFDDYCFVECGKLQGVSAPSNCWRLEEYKI